VAQAQAQLRQGQSVTQAMLAAGFDTKSNFNREFLRVTVQTPSAWRQGALQVALTPPARFSTPCDVRGGCRAPAI